MSINHESKDIGEIIEEAMYNGDLVYQGIKHPYRKHYTYEHLGTGEETAATHKMPRGIIHTEQAWDNSIVRPDGQWPTTAPILCKWSSGPSIQYGIPLVFILIN